MRLVVVESPFRADTEIQGKRNIAYARACLRDCFMQGEAPLASHLLYTQDGVLDDSVKHDRDMGIEAGLQWSWFAEATVVYVDLGISPGMQLAIDRAKADGRPIEYRTLGRMPELGLGP